ncbi:coat protein [Hydrangea chlorotic mottle virus]|uniref:Capsid protein n=1 Tax=Hydrangea chlorotic mottle virus TaxID=375546 RepID=B3VKH5_9VIRU|nr:coat protein [Hydrangea chlorotic mottle virus]ACE78185.2 coat protein [Hydrangea chlorotic mottle virus]
MPPKENPILQGQEGGSGSHESNVERNAQHEASEQRRRPPRSTGGNHESQLEQRLTKLIDTLNEGRYNSNLQNISFEIGRPNLEPVLEMKRNPANPYGRFSVDELFKMPVSTVSNNMANTEEMAKISSALAGMGVPTEFVAEVILKMAIMCASVSSSAFLDPSGSIEFPGGAIPVDSVAAIMKRESGLRRVCRLYAPVVWNSMLVRKQPPSDWQAMGFPFNARYAAFDTFDYVTNAAAIQPVEGLIRLPTPAEYIAHNAHKRLAIDKSNRNEKFANLETEVHWRPSRD